MNVGDKVRLKKLDTDELPGNILECIGKTGVVIRVQGETCLVEFEENDAFITTHCDNLDQL